MQAGQGRAWPSHEVGRYSNLQGVLVGLSVIPIWASAWSF